MIGSLYWNVENQLDEAARWLRKSASVDPEDFNTADYLGTLFLDLGDLDRAEYWSERSVELAPESLFSNIAMQLLQLYRGDLSTALEYGRRAFKTQDNKSFFFHSFQPVRIHEMRAGRYLEARAAFEKIAPELLNEESPKINTRNYQAAIDLALILSKTGEQQRADWLIENSLQYIQQIPRLGRWGYGIADVQIYAVQGDKQKALSALQRAIDEGWRGYWWFYLIRFSTSFRFNGDPEFIITHRQAITIAQCDHIVFSHRLVGIVEIYPVNTDVS